MVISSFNTFQYRKKKLLTATFTTFNVKSQQISSIHPCKISDFLRFYQVDNVKQILKIRQVGYNVSPRKTFGFEKCRVEHLPLFM